MKERVKVNLFDIYVGYVICGIVQDIKIASAFIPPLAILERKAPAVQALH